MEKNISISELEDIYKRVNELYDDDNNSVLLYEQIYEYWRGDREIMNIAEENMFTAQQAHIKRSDFIEKIKAKLEFEIEKQKEESDNNENSGNDKEGENDI